MSNTNAENDSWDEGSLTDTENQRTICIVFLDTEKAFGKLLQDRRTAKIKDKDCTLSMVWYSISQRKPRQ